MEADCIPKISAPLSQVLQQEGINIPTSRAEHSNDISCSVFARLMDFPIPIALFHMVADDRSDRLQLFGRRFLRESGELLK